MSNSELEVGVTETNVTEGQHEEYGDYSAQTESRYVHRDFFGFVEHRLR